MAEAVAEAPNQVAVPEAPGSEDVPAQAEAAPLIPDEAAPDAPVLPADPSRWPVSQIRLLGTWQQGAQWQAVLGTAEVGVPVQVGRRVAQEGHRVESIRRDAVRLRSAQGQVIELTWSGSGR